MLSGPTAFLAFSKSRFQEEEKHTSRFTFNIHSIWPRQFRFQPRFRREACPPHSKQPFCDPLFLYLHACRHTWRLTERQAASTFGLPGRGEVTGEVWHTRLKHSLATWNSAAIQSA